MVLFIISVRRIVSPDGFLCSFITEEVIHNESVFYHNTLKFERLKCQVLLTREMRKSVGQKWGITEGM